MKSLKAALISALAGQGMEIFLFFLGGVLLQKAEDPLKNLPFLTYLSFGCFFRDSFQASPSGRRHSDAFDHRRHPDRHFIASVPFYRPKRKNGGTKSAFGSPYIAVPSFAGNVFEKIQSKRKIQSEAGKKAL